MNEPPNAGEIYTGYIQRQLALEDARLTSVNERASRLQQSSAVTVTLFATALGVVTSKGIQFPFLALIFFAVMLLSFIVAIVFGIRAGKFVEYEAATPETMHAMIDEHGIDDRSEGIKNITDLDLIMLEQIRNQSKSKVASIEVGVGCEIAGLIAGSITVGLAMLKL